MPRIKHFKKTNAVVLGFLLATVFVVAAVVVFKDRVRQAIDDRVATYDTQEVPLDMEEYKRIPGQ